jgi:hypothetical protein
LFEVMAPPTSSETRLCARARPGAKNREIAKAAQSNFMGPSFTLAASTT